MQARVTCTHVAGKQTYLFGIWFDAADEKWVGSTKRGHQGMERILKSRKRNSKDQSLQKGKELHFMQ